MTAKQHAVLWMGLILIIVRLVVTSQGKLLWQSITGTGGNTGGISGGFMPPSGPSANPGDTFGIPQPPANPNNPFSWLFPGLGPI